MKLAYYLKHETGYDFSGSERLRVYLTNALEPAVDQYESENTALAHEAEAVNGIKRDQRFTVVIGNPPYSISSGNDGEWITSIMNEYKEHVRNEQNLQPLSDDYVKFVRLAHHLVVSTGIGIVGFITNHTFLSGLIHRGMRHCLLRDFQDITVIDLHGSALLGLRAPDGGEDKNVFDIQQGVAITLSRRRANHDSMKSGELFHADLWGSRQHKYQALDAKVCAEFMTNMLDPQPPNCFFVPSRSRDEDYDSWPSVTTVFCSHSTGLETGRDEILIGFDETAIKAVCRELHSPRLSNAAVETKFGLRDTSGWPFRARLSRFRSLPLSQAKQFVRRILYRPFDARFTIYSDLLRRAQFENQRHMIMPNIGLVASRIIKGEKPAHAYASKLPIEKILISPKTSNNAFLFPLYRCSGEGLFSQTDGTSDLPVQNLNSSFVRSLAHALGEEVEDASALPVGLTPEDIFRYVYSVLHSPGYRSNYAEFLKIDFPRIPLPGTSELFNVLSRLGQELVSLHLMESPQLDDYITTLIGSGNFQVEKVAYSDETVWLDKDHTRGFEGVPEEVWNFHIGGYQVCHKWLKDRQAKGGQNPRPGRILTPDDVDHYQKIVVALSETIRIMTEIDEVIDKHGGWPDAFVTGKD
jgi:predicted helicase